MGEYLKNPQITYLLPATKEFFETTDNPIYKSYSEILKSAVSAPALSDDERAAIGEALKRTDLPLPNKEDSDDTNAGCSTASEVFMCVGMLLTSFLFH